MSPRWHQLPQEPPLARFIPETTLNVAPLSGQMRFFFCDARPRPPASDYKCDDKSKLFGTVPSRAHEMHTFEALENSKRENCRLAPTKHPLSSILEVRISIQAPESVRVAAPTRIASGSLLGGAWQAEHRLLSICSKL